MNLWDAVCNVFRNYANFSGRAKRSEFWYFYLFNVLVGVVMVILAPIAIFVAPAYALAALVPGLAVAVRRLHDTNRSGVYLLFSFIPLVGFILLIVWLAEDSFPGPNMSGFEAPVVYAPQHRSAPRAAVLGIRCLSGPLQGHTYPVAAGGVTIGRDASCAVRLPDSTPGVSSRHCMIQIKNGAPVITDLGSSFGTFLSDGRRLPVQYPFPAHVGMRFYLGGGEAQFELVAM